MQGILMPRIRRSLSAIMLICYLPACTSWHVETVAPERVVREQEPREVRIFPPDGQGYCLTTGGVYRATFGCLEKRLDMESPSVSGDSLVGLIRGNKRVIPLEEIGQVAIRKHNTLKTVIAVLTPFAAIALVAGIACAVHAETTNTNC